MKKLFLGLFAVLMVAPLSVFAATDDYTLKYESDAKVCEDEICTVNIDITLESYVDDEITIGFDNFTIEYTVGDQSTVTFDPANDFSSSSIENSVITISAFDYVVEGKDSVFLGTITMTYPDESGYDCTIGLDAALDASSTTVTIVPSENVQTGINIPLIAVGTLGVLAVGAYLVVSKKNKIYNV